MDISGALSAVESPDPADGLRAVAVLRRLAERLEGIRSVSIVGLALDYCVKETALDASRSFITTLFADGTKAVNLQPGDGARAVAEMVAAGVRVV